MTIEVDYIIAGAGAVGMAFADVILSDSDATIAIIDRHHKPGGHWNMAYPFVTLHQPSTFYGVSSTDLSHGEFEKVGLNKGLQEMASGPEIMAYYDRVMRQQFLPTGRVQYFPMCRYQESDNALEGSFTSITSGKTQQIRARKKFVDATHLTASVPSSHKPKFNIADGVQFMPLNNLPRLHETPEGYVVIGGGKTGIDACLWLLDHQVDPDKITWIKSRDAWLYNRRNAQTDFAFFNDTMGATANQFESIANSTSIEDMYDRFEQSGYFLRIYKDTKPTMFHAASVSEAEIDALRQIKNVIRMGKVTELNENEIILEKGRIPTNKNVVHVDCSASPVDEDCPVPIFQGNKVVPQTIRAHLPVFSAALVAHIELAYNDEAEQNRLAAVVPLPNSTDDFLRLTLVNMMNQYNWSQDKELRRWIADNRLDGFTQMARKVDGSDQEKMDIMNRIKTASFPAVAKLQEYVAQIDQPEKVAS